MGVSELRARGLRYYTLVFVDVLVRILHLVCFLVGGLKTSIARTVNNLLKCLMKL